MQTTVWDFLEFDCALFATMDPVASGRSKLITVDNDLLGIEEGDMNTNSWAFMAHGRLVSADGSPAQFSGFIRQVLGTNSGYKLVSKIVLR